MKQVYKKNIVILIITTLSIFLIGVELAKAQYAPLVSLPGITAGQPITLSSYLNAIFKIGIGLAAVFAVLMIIISGVQLVGGAASPSARTEAKERISNAILGLILALGAVFLLSTINPALLNTSLTVTRTTPVNTNTTSSKPKVNKLYCVSIKNIKTGTTSKSCDQSLSGCKTIENYRQQNPNYRITSPCSTQTTINGKLQARQYCFIVDDLTGGTYSDCRGTLPSCQKEEARIVAKPLYSALTSCK